MKRTYIQRTILTVLISVSMIFAGPSHAQTMMPVRPLSTGFLLEFAQRLVERGEYDEAESVLTRILKSEPENPPIKRLLKTVEDQRASKVATAFRSSRPSDIASDIIFIQNNVLLFERRNRDLEFAIRKILQENIFLYQTLSRRNRELLELRKKFFGYDGDISDQTSSGSAQKTNEILNAYEGQIAQRDQAFVQRNQEISRTMKEVGKIGDALKEHKTTSQNMDSALNAGEWKDDLTEKRSYLVEKALTLYEKNKDLTLLYSELEVVTKSLKEANQSYGETVSEYEVKIQKLNNVWVQDKVKQQTEIDQLKDQIKNKKVKMMAARLSPETDQADDAITAPPSTEFGVKKLNSSPSKLAQDVKTRKSVVSQDLARSKLDPQSEIKRLEGELARKEKEISDRSRMFDAKIRELKDGWAKEKTITQQTIVHQKLKSAVEPADDDAVKASNLYRDMVQQLDYLKDQLSMREEELHKFQDDMLGHTSQLEKLQKKLSQRESRLADMDALIVAKDQQIMNLKRELVVKIAEVNEKNKTIEELRANSVPSQEGLKDLRKRVVAVKPSGRGSDRPVEELKALVAELKNNLGTDPTLNGPIEDLKQQLAGALEALQQKDQDIQDLKVRLEDDKKLSDLRASSVDDKSMDSRVREYEQVIDRLKARLSRVVEERREAERNWQTATKKLSAMDDDAKQIKGDRDEPSQPVDDLAQKVRNLSNELEEQAAAFNLQSQTLRDKLAQKDEEIAGLKSKLGIKEKQVQQFSDSMEKATQKLNAQSLSRDQQPTVPAMSAQKSGSQSDLVKEKDQQEWNPADNDVYALQQRLNTLGKELQYTQDELASRTKENGHLNEKLKEKEPESPRALVEKDNFETKDVVKLENELNLFRQQSDLTKTTIKLQQSSLAKSQKDIDQKEKSLRSVVEQLEKLKKQVGDYKSTVQEKDEQIIFQQKALDHEIQKNETLRKKLHDIDRTAGVEQERDAQKDQSVTDLKDNLKTYEIRERDYKHQISDIQDQLKTSYVMIEDGENRMAALKKRLAVREERIVALQNELDRRKGQDKNTKDVQTLGPEK